MRAHWITATAAVFLTVGVAAAQTGTATPSTSSPQTQRNNSSSTVTVVGCVQRAGNAVGATSGTAAGSADEFVLSNARMSAAGESGAAGGARGSGATTPA